MKITKYRLQKTMSNNKPQTRKKYKHHKLYNHTNTNRNKKKFNLRTKTLKHN